MLCGASGTASGVTYAWSGPLGYTSTVSNPTLSSVTTGMAGVYTVTASNTSSGCSITGTTNVTVNTISVSASNNSPACVGGTVNILSGESGTAPGVTYVWSGPLGYTSTVSNPTLSSVTTGMAGTYTVTASNTSSGCNATGITNVTVNTIAVAPTNNGPACVGGSITMSSVETGSAPSVTYVWNGPSGYTSTNVNPVLSSLTTGMAGIYTVTASNSASGCSATGTTNVTINTIAVAPTNNGPACVGGSITMSTVETGSAPSVTYVWNGPAGYTSTNLNPVLGSLTTGMAGVYTVTASNTSSGCSATGTSNVTVNTIAVAPTNNSPACAGGSITLSSVETGTAPSVVYSWSGPLGYTSTSANPTMSSLLTTMSGVYTVTASNSASGCSAIGTTNVIVNPGPTTAPTNDGPACAGGTLNLNAHGTSTGTPSYSWSGPNGFTSTLATPSIGSVTLLAAGVYSVSINTAGSACSSASSTTVVIKPAPSLTSVSNNGPLCAGNTLNLSSGTAANVTDYSWVGPNAFVSTLANPSISSPTATATGIYSVTVLNGAGSGCSATYTTSATINRLPNPVTVSGGGTFCNGTTITATNGGDGTIYFQGTTSGGTSTSVPATSQVVSVTGTYYFRAMLPSGCWGPEGSVSVLIPAITGSPAVCIGLTVNFSCTGGAGTWSSSNLAFASVGSSTGIVTGVGTGTATISYNMTSGCLVKSNIYSSTVAPPISGPGRVCVGQSITLTEPIPGGTWVSSIPTAATAGATTGIITGMASGFIPTITYTLGPSCKAMTTVTVSALSAISGPTSVCQGRTITLHDATTGGTWVSNNTSLATVVSTTGVVSGILSGTATISYVLPTGCVATMDLPVGPLSPIIGPSSVCVGQTIALTDLDAGGTWSSSAITIATIGSTGIVTGIAGNLTTIISYSFSTGCRATQIVSVNALSATTGSSGVCLGQTITLNNSTAGGNWSSSNTTVASVGSTGIVTGAAVGSAIITYSLPSGCTTTSIVAVSLINPIVGASVVCQGQTTTYTNASAGGVWSSAAPTIASVGSTGVVSGIAAGLSTTISYTLGTGCRVTKTITVNAISAITGLSNVCQGRTIALADATSGGVWSSSAATVASVGTNGIVTGVGFGTTIISYTVPSGCIATKVIISGQADPISGPSVVCVGQTITMTETTTGGVWSSSAPTIATVSSGSGMVTGIAGSLAATISYTLASGCRSTLVVSVNPAAAILSRSTYGCVGQSITMTNTVLGGTWSSGTPAVGTIDAATGGRGAESGAEAASSRSSFPMSGPKAMVSPWSRVQLSCCSPLTKVPAVDFRSKTCRLPSAFCTISAWCEDMRSSSTTMSLSSSRPRVMCSLRGTTTSCPSSRTKVSLAMGDFAVKPAQQSR